MGRIWRVASGTFSIIMPALYVAIGLTAIATLRWAMAGIGVWMFSKAYLRFKIGRAKIDWTAEGQNESTMSDSDARDTLRRVGIFYWVASAFVVVGWIAGEGWGWVVLAAFLLWYGVVLVYAEKLGPRDMPARWFP